MSSEGRVGLMVDGDLRRSIAFRRAEKFLLRGWVDRGRLMTQAAGNDTVIVHWNRATETVRRNNMMSVSRNRRSKARREKKDSHNKVRVRLE